MIIPKQLNVIMHNSSYYTSLVNNKHCLYSFKNNHNAVKCANFLAEYKHRFDTFPPINSDEYIPKSVELSKRKPIYEILHQELQIITEKTNDLLSLCGSTGLELLILNHFEYNLNSELADIKFSAINIQPTEEDYSSQLNIEYLNSLL
jgi:hypothetical protein